MVHAVFPGSAWRLLAGRHRLAGLAADLLAGVAHALALVGLGRPRAADARGELADRLAIDALHVDGRRVGRLDRDALRDRQHDRVAEPDRQRQGALLELRLVADAVDLEALRVAGGHALDHVAAESA